MKPQSPEEIARAAQEAALEQMRAMMGSIPGMPDMGDMQHRSWPRCRPQCQIWWRYRRSRLRWGTLGGVDAAAVAEAARQNMAQAAATMQAMQDGSLEKEFARGKCRGARLAWRGRQLGN